MDKENNIDDITFDGEDSFMMTDEYESTVIFNNITSSSSILPSTSAVGTIMLDSNDSSIYINDGITWTPLAGDTIYNTNIEEMIEQQKQEEKLRDENPNVNEAWEHYQLMLKMCQDDEIDETTLFKNGVKDD